MDRIKNEKLNYLHLSFFSIFGTVAVLVIMPKLTSELLSLEETIKNAILNIETKQAKIIEAKYASSRRVVFDDRVKMEQKENQKKNMEKLLEELNKDLKELKKNLDIYEFEFLQRNNMDKDENKKYLEKFKGEVSTKICLTSYEFITKNDKMNKNFKTVDSFSKNKYDHMIENHKPSISPVLEQTVQESLSLEAKQAFINAYEYDKILRELTSEIHEIDDNLAILGNICDQIKCLVVKQDEDINTNIKEYNISYNKIVHGNKVLKEIPKVPTDCIFILLLCLHGFSIVLLVFSYLF